MIDWVAIFPTCFAWAIILMQGLVIVCLESGAVHRICCMAVVERVVLAEYPWMWLGRPLGAKARACEAVVMDETGLRKVEVSMAGGMRVWCT